MPKNRRALETRALNISGRNPFVVLCLPLLLFPVSLVYAQTSQHHAWQQNMKAGVEVGWGMPSVWLIKKEIEKNRTLGDGVTVEIPTNWQVGLVWGYGFPLVGGKLSLGPELGVSVGTQQKITISSRSGGTLGTLELAERYVHIPIGLKFSSIDNGVNWIRWGFNLGYEIGVLLSSEYKLSDDTLAVREFLVNFRNNSADAASMERAITNPTQYKGTLFLEPTIEFPKGFYGGVKIKVPVALFDLVQSEQSSDAGTKFMDAFRVLSSSLVEIVLGVDILKWF